MMYYDTVNDLLKNTLITLMESSVFDSFRLVGGTVEVPRLTRLSTLLPYFVFVGRTSILLGSTF